MCGQKKSDRALKEMKYKHLFSQECKWFKSRFSAHSVFIRVSILYHEDGRLNKGLAYLFSVLDIKVKNVIFPVFFFNPQEHCKDSSNMLIVKVCGL